MTSHIIRLTLLALQLAFLIPKTASAYSVLTHEAIIDSAWDTTFKPLLLKRFPAATEEELKQAHAYSYGGAIIQDMGYYPFSSKFFSDLVHYVRSGDFVANLLRDAQDLNEYAFALGAMAHYWADSFGHPEGVNVVVPIVYPKLRRKFGTHVTYEDDPAAHLKTEFGFDVLEVARGNFAPQSYHDFIGFKVSKPVLERAFEDTYSIPLKDVFKDLDLALGTYRRTVSRLLPEMTKAAWAANKDDIQKAHPGITARKFRYNLSQAEYHKEWNEQYVKPGIGARFLAFLFKIMPKIGPFRALGFRMPTAQGETMFMQSFNDSLARVKSFVPETDVQLPNRNFDTGEPTRQGVYHMADETYCKLLDTYADKQLQPSEQMRANILAFFEDPAKITDPKAITELNVLKSTPAVPSR
jgi:Zinc dependent phospholipase C